MDPSFEFIQRANEVRAWEDAYLAASKQYSPWSNHRQEAKRKATEKREAKKCHRITE